MDINGLGPEGSTWSYYTFDQQGNVVQRLDSGRNHVASRIFEAWGQGMESTLPRNLDPFAYNAQWGYYYDRETGLYLCGFRYYDPASARWLNRDPIGYAGGVNLYGYCGQSPVIREDRKGLLYDSVSRFCIRYPIFCSELSAEIAGTTVGGAIGLADGPPGTIPTPAGTAGSLIDDVINTIVSLLSKPCGKALFGQAAHKVVGRRLANSGYGRGTLIDGGVTDFENEVVSHIIELKPATQSGVGAGLSQLERYIRDRLGFGGDIVLYPAPWWEDGWEFTDPTFFKSGL